MDATHIRSGEGFMCGSGASMGPQRRGIDLTHQASNASPKTREFAVKLSSGRVCGAVGRALSSRLRH